MKKLFYLLVFCLFFNAAFASNYYWVNGTGSLSDYAHHWATTSGGSIFHTQLPTANDSVFFDANSFPTVNDTVQLDVANFVCRNMDWTGSANKTPVVITQNNQHKTFEIHGSLIFTSNLLAIGTLNDTIDIHFCSNRSGNVIYTAGNGGNFQFDSSGVDTLKDVCDIGNLNLLNGTLIVLNSNSNQAMNLWDFTIGSQSAPPSTVPKFYCYSPNVRFQNFYNYATNYVLKADSTSFTIGGFMDCRSGNHFKFVGASSISSAHNKFDQLLLWVAGSLGIAGSASHFISNSAYDTIQTLTVESPNSNYSIDTLISTGDYIKNINLTVGSSNWSVFHFIPHQTFIDSIYWSTPAGNSNKLIIEANDTLQIKKTFFNNYATIQSSIAGVQCYVKLKTPSCWAGSTNNDIDFCGTGTAILDSTIGLVQTNISGNFIYGTCSDMVWPGETNRDFAVNNLDILNIGVANGSTGAARVNPTLNFSPQNCTDWTQQFSNWQPYNYKFADCDGNGIINANDTLAVSLNYGQTRAFRLAKHNKSGNTNLAIQLPNNILPNTSYSLPILIGDVNNPLNAIYGAAFSIMYDDNQIDASSVSIDFSNSWIKSGNQFLAFQKNLTNESSMDATIVRTNQTDTSGFGVIGMLTFKTKATASGNLIFDFNSIKTEVIDHQANSLAIGWTADTAKIISSGINSISSTNDLQILVYPNPTNHSTVVSLQHAVNNATIQLVNLLGETVLTKTNQSGNQFTIDLSAQPQGIYFVEVQQQGNVWRGKVVKE